MQMNSSPAKKEFVRAADFIRSHTSLRPEIGIVLGSGLCALSDSVDPVNTIAYAEIPGWPASTVPGHESKLVLGNLEGRAVAVMCGRVHYYEGYDLAQVTFPMRVFQQMGIRLLILTNAAGAVNPGFKPGDLMLIRDHLNLIGMAGLNPLRGPNDDSLGVRFPDLSQAYDRSIGRLAYAAAEQASVPFWEGVYACLAGPSFETPADLRFLRNAGVDAVGMSTVPEVIVARHAGIRVLGLSGISNKANLDGQTITTHEEVLAAGSIIAPRLTSVIRGVLRTAGDL
jgi:purine-nucleoside phosphorylase